MFGDAAGFQKISRNHRRNHTRNRKAHQDRGNNSEAEILEELPRHTGHQANRQEHRDNREGGRDNRKSDFVGRIN